MSCSFSLVLFLFLPALFPVSCDFSPISASDGVAFPRSAASNAVNRTTLCGKTRIFSGPGNTGLSPRKAAKFSRIVQPDALRRSQPFFPEIPAFASLSPFWFPEASPMPWLLLTLFVPSTTSREYPPPKAAFAPCSDASVVIISIGRSSACSSCRIYPSRALNSFQV